MLQEGEFIEVHLRLEESVFQLSRNRRRILWGVTVDTRCRRIKEAAILDHVIAHLPHLLDFVRFGEEVVACREQTTDRREQPGALLLAQFGPERVDGDVDGTTVAFKRENVVHNLVRRPANFGLDELVKVLQVRLVQRVSNDFNVQVIEVGS